MPAPRPRLALPFTIVPADGQTHLIFGEDVRYTLRSGEHTACLVSLLRRCDGTNLLDALLKDLPADEQRMQSEFCTQLYGERILVEGPAEAAHVAATYRPVPEGSGPLVARLARTSNKDARPLPILCQDTLDLRSAQEFNRRCLSPGQSPWMWVSTAAASRGYVSPAFLPSAGPCLACLLAHFERLSPTPQLYQALFQHARQRGEFAPAPFPPEAVEILARLAEWKVEQLASGSPASAVFRLHVLELETMEVSVHRVFSDPLCADCADARLA